MKRALWILTMICLMGVQAPATIAQSVVGVDDITLFSQAEDAYRQNNMERALALYEQCYQTFPHSPVAPAALFRSADLYARKGDTTASRDAYERLIVKYPRDPRANESVLAVMTIYDKEGNSGAVIRRSQQAVPEKFTPDQRFRYYSMLADAQEKNNLLVSLQNWQKALENATTETQRNTAREQIQSAMSSQSISKLESYQVQVSADGFAAGCLLFGQGEQLYRQGNMNDAWGVWNQIPKEGPASLFYPVVQQRQKEGLPLTAEAIGRGPVIGCLLPLSGKYAKQGEMSKRGIELAVQQANRTLGKPVQLIVHDVGSQGERLQEGMERMAKENVSVLLGPITAEASLQAAKMAGSLKIPILLLTSRDSLDEANKYVFRMFLTPEMQVSALVKKTIQSNRKNVAILYPTGKYGETFLKLFSEQLKVQGGNVLFSQGYSPSQTDFTAIVQKVKSYRSGTSGKLDAVFISDGVRNSKVIISQFSEKGVLPVQLYGTHLWYSAAFLDDMGTLLDGAILPVGFFVGSKDPGVRALVAAFSATYSEAPDLFAATAYDAAGILVRVVNMKPNSTRDDIQKALSTTGGFSGVTGFTRFRADGDAMKEAILIKVQGADFVEEK